jgi:Rps23 Pro-64 3,4-dihydroxylase Tpa1-like proline 4-hydroxylase
VTAKEGIRLNPGLEISALADAFARSRRIHIPSILTEDSAVRVLQCLAQETDFSLLCQTGTDQAAAYRTAGLDPRKESELMTAAYARARDRFEYLYDAHSLSKEGEPYPNPAHYLAEINLFLNGEAMLAFVRKVTRRPEINAASIQATRYRQGHFLNQHDDGNDPRRIAAYVLNMTPHWRWDWGGALLFSDRPGHVSEGFLPAFNALNMFAVPQEHQVGFVAPFAGGHRYSITGWFLAR